ncbi:hypothetical protein [Thalassospira lucentensis]|uniref:hypothetical protein n=1 Tax=Thalassospira lucentensis TaxID=168935 RepID=UPI00142D3939|nr:hypothetical protein [Thalassospira lucentensis]NIZ01230.1 hypothetical protein [Thalassospira lucentensis]
MRNVTFRGNPGEKSDAVVGRADVRGMARNWAEQSASGREVSVLVVFGDAPEKKLLRLLKPGFRHCFVLISGARAGEWICLDPQSHRIRCESWCYSPLFDPASYYRAIGYHCIWASYPASVAHHIRLGPMSCVELIKRLLGVSGVWIITPWQLYRALVKRGEKTLTSGDVHFSEKCS